MIFSYFFETVQYELLMQNKVIKIKIKIKIKIFYFRSKRPIDRTCITVIKYGGTLHKNIYIKSMAINCYYINNNSFHGFQISNLNT